MAEQRCAAAGLSEPSPGEQELGRAAVTGLLTGALLPLLEARCADPVGFLAEHFTQLAAAEDGGAEEMMLSRALWSLSLAHHSHRSAFSGNVRVSYDLLSRCGRHGDGGGEGVCGRLYADLLQSLCSEGGLSVRTAAPLLRRIQSHTHERVPFPLFQQGALTCCVFADYIRRSQCLYAAVASAKDRPAPRALCEAVLQTLRSALETEPHVERLLQASAKISPAKVAQVLAEARPRGNELTMDAQEFEDAAAALFIARVHTVS